MDINQYILILNQTSDKTNTYNHLTHYPSHQYKLHELNDVKHMQIGRQLGLASKKDRIKSQGYTFNPTNKHFQKIIIINEEI